MRNEAMLVLVFVFQNMLLLTKYGRVSFSLFFYKCYLKEYTVVGCKVYGDVWVHVYAFWVHVYGSVGCMYAVVGCKVCGDVWVHVCGSWVQVS